MSSEHREELEALMMQWIEARHLGVDRLEELCRESPEHEAALRRRARALEEVGMVPMGAGVLLEEALPRSLGPYRLEERLGSGAMGVVYRARQEGLGRDVAVKLIRPDLVAFENSRARFEREVSAVSRLEHPSIVTVYAVGEDEGVPYFSMEYVGGVSLERVLEIVRGQDPASLEGEDLRRIVTRFAARRGPSGSDSRTDHFTGGWVDAVVRIFVQVARALEHAHERGVHHRDVKPSNIMITPSGRALLVDFGLAGLHGSQRLTQSGSPVGSLPYMSPEQLRGDSRQVGPRSDVYSLGVALFEMLTLQLPYLGQDPVATRTLVVEGSPPRLRREQPRASADLETVCLTAMARERRDRYASATSLREDLEFVLDGHPVRAPASRAPRSVGAFRAPPTLARHRMDAGGTAVRRCSPGRDRLAVA